MEDNRPHETTYSHEPLPCRTKPAASESHLFIGVVEDLGDLRSEIVIDPRIGSFDAEFEIS